MSGKATRAIEFASEILQNWGCVEEEQRMSDWPWNAASTSDGIEDIQIKIQGILNTLRDLELCLGDSEPETWAEEVVQVLENALMISQILKGQSCDYRWNHELTEIGRGIFQCNKGLDDVIDKIESRMDQVPEDVLQQKKMEKTEQKRLMIEDMLRQVLSNKRRIKALYQLRGDFAQQILNLLDCELQLSESPEVISQSLSAIRELSARTKLYPSCAILDDSVTIGSRIGRAGGFCDVYEGGFQGEQLYIKVIRLKPSLNERTLKIYAKEAIRWGQLDHPNVACFYGMYYLNDPNGQRLCLVSPRMARCTLIQYLMTNPVENRIPFIYDVARGLKYLHSQPIIHGDLTGKSIVINDHNMACITDHGISAIRNDHVLAKSNPTFAGRSLRYVAQELIDEDRVRPTLKSDIWAFGMVCYEILTRRQPFDGMSALEAAVEIKTGGLPLRSSLDSDSQVDQIDDKMWDLLNKCWTWDPEERPICKEIFTNRVLAKSQKWRNVIPTDDATRRNKLCFQRTMSAGKKIWEDLAWLESIEEVLNDL